MSKARDNHYVPEWYQRGFIEPDREKLKYLDLAPPVHIRGDGSEVFGKSLFDSAPSRCFVQTDLYTTAFGFEINDEIERRLFGEIDNKGAPAVRAFTDNSVEGWMRHFEDMFEYIDAQKLRTPKGLEWLRRHYPFLDQNQLMFEMQGVRMMHCTMWAEGVREIVSAEDAGIKFLISDHPVTVFNHAAPPDHARCAYPNDPPIAWKASQTIYPLDRNFCMILTNLEYAKQPDLADPCSKRTNARNFRQSLIRTDAFIHGRKLTDGQVCEINHILKTRANRYVAAGREEWLYPEKQVTGDWASLRATLLPPNDELWRFGGETYIGYKDGSTAYQDEFGRTEPHAPFLTKEASDARLHPRDECGCGSGKAWGVCCSKKPAALRPSWNELSIRERNLMHARAISKILGIAEGKNWEQARRDLTDEKIAEIHKVFRVLWPPDTDLISLLPKPDGRLRALYTGIVDPRMVIEYALGSANYFGEILIQSPFHHPAGINKDFDPTKNPAMHRQETVKNVALLLDMMPLIAAGIVNFFPDPCHFDLNLRHQMMQMAIERTDGLDMAAITDLRIKWLQRDDFERGIWSMPEEAQRSTIKGAIPELTPDQVNDVMEVYQQKRRRDPLALLQDNPIPSKEEGGLLIGHHMLPNFEMSLFIAQATGSIIVTDSPHRWCEIVAAGWMQSGRRPDALPRLRAAIEETEHLFLGDQWSIAKIHMEGNTNSYASLMHDVFRYLTITGKKGPKPNWEAQLPKRFKAAHSQVQNAIQKTGDPMQLAKLKCVMPPGGIRENSINRLLLMSNVDTYLENIPMAFYIERSDPLRYNRADLGDS